MARLGSWIKAHPEGIYVAPADAWIDPSQPKPKAPAAKSSSECRFLKEEDERLTCYNGFVDKLPKLPR